MTETKRSTGALHEKNERLKIWVSLIALVVTNAVALITSISAHKRADDETKAKSAYKELSSAMAEVSKDNIQIHNDLSNLRGYLAGLAQNGALSIPKIDNPSAPALRPITRVGTIPAPTAKSSPPTITFKAAPEPPKMSEKPPPYLPKPVDKL